MSYIIVIEVDNVFAREAYAKGLADLDLAMPEILAQADAWDARNEEKYLIKKERYDKEMATAVAESEVYLKEFKLWSDSLDKRREWKRNGLIFSKEPEVHPQPISKSRSYPSIVPHRYDKAATRYKLVRDKIVEKLNLSELALKPFQMAEPDVHLMISLSNGSYVDKLKKEVAKLKDIVL